MTLQTLLMLACIWHVAAGKNQFFMYEYNIEMVIRFYFSSSNKMFWTELHESLSFSLFMFIYYPCTWKRVESGNNPHSFLQSCNIFYSLFNIHYFTNLFESFTVRVSDLF